MDPNPLAVLKFIAPQIPSISYTALSHSLGFGPQSSVWDVRTAVTVQVLRNIMTADNGKRKRQPIKLVQDRTLQEPGIKGKTWVVTAKLPKPEEEQGGIRDVVFKAVEDMKPSTTGEVKYTKPELVDIEIEWTGHRPAARDNEPPPKVSEEEKYKLMMADVKSEVTILYFHGGAYYLCDPKTHRGPVGRLAKESGGRVASVRYRLAPQTAFPGQLIDALMVYLSLLYPTAGSMHEAVPAEKIVLGGDSAGGNLSMGLLQLLLQMHRSSEGVPVVKFHGRDVHVPLPAGCSANSGWFDISRSMPSIEANAATDYLPPPNHDDNMSTFPHDEAWPTKPPRGDLFCELELLDHPLASLHMADSWKDSPPLWFCTGQEMLTDEDKLVVSKCAQQGVTVHFEQYEAMPHCFQMLIPHLATSNRCLRSWAEWARKCVEEPASLKTNGTFCYAKGGKEEPIDVHTMNVVSFTEAKKRCEEAKERRLKGWEKEGKTMPKPAL